MKKILIILSGFLFAINSYAQTYCVRSLIDFEDHFIETYTFEDGSGILVSYDDYRVKYISSTYDWGSSFVPNDKITTSSSSYQLTLKAMRTTFNITQGHLVSENEVTKTITITNNPQAILANLPTKTSIEPSFTLTQGSPAGGTYSGTGVSGTSFSPATAGVGTHTVTYTITQSSCSTSQSKSLVVTQGLLTKSAISVPNVCQNGANINLSAYTSGTFSGTGITGTDFVPATAGAGTHTITNSESGYFNTNFTITVLASPTVSLSTFPTDKYVDDASFTLTQGSPTGGTYSGTGVSGTSFAPATAGAGTHTITYSYTNGNCTETASQSITVMPKKADEGISNRDFCIGTAAITLSDGSPAGGTYRVNGVIATTFNPNIAGTYTVTYDVEHYEQASAVYTVNALPNVTLAVVDPICTSTASVNLNGKQSPATGGTFSGTGMNGTTFYSSQYGASGADTYTATYTYTDASTACTNSASRNIVVNALPNVTLAAVDPICISTASVNLNGKQSPAGGTFSGTGISGTLFTTATAGEGTHTVTYTYTDANICTNSASRNIVVNALPTVTLGTFDAVCHNTGAVALSGGLPADGTYSGTGVSGTEFDPATVGTHAITYTYTDGNGCTSSTNNNIVVNALPTVTLSDFSSMCENEAPLTLSGGSPVGGIYNYTDNESAISSGVFYPSIANIGDHPIIYTYTDGNGCTNSASKGLMLLDAPNVSLTNPSDVCQNAPYIVLSGGSPQGGTYYIDGVAMVGYTPSGLSVGDHTLRYEYSLPNGCTDFAEQVLTILESPVVTLGTFDNICQNGEVLSLSSGSPSGSSGEYYVNGANKTTFNPTSYNVGDHTIKYEYTLGNGCSSYEQQPITVLEAPVVSLGSFSAICENEEPVSLSSGSPVGGTYSGTGVSGTQFNPASAGAGTYTITYTYTNGSGCTETASQNIVVYAVTAVNFTSLPRVCVNADSFELTQGSPLGGTYSGTGVVNGSFYPSQAGASTHTITYTYTNGNGCVENATQTIIVDDITAITFPILDGICENADVLTLNTATPIDGEYSGAGVSGTIFYPSVADVGSHAITYTYTNANGCINSSSRNVTVFEKPDVTISAYDDLCGNVPEFELTGGLPLGGTYSGNGVADNKFTAKDASVGTHVITYTYTNANGCNEIAETTITVLESAFVDLSPLDDICENAEPLNLSVTSAESGVYTGAGVNNGKFYPALTGTGIFPVTYTYTNANGCSDSDTENITVLASPNVTLTAFVSVCENNDPITLSGGSPAGGIYSGTGIIGGEFIPQIGAGAYTIRYTYDNGSCEDYAEQTIIVKSAPIVSVKYFGNVCHNAPEFTLSGGSPIGGTYYVDGLEKTKINPSSLTVGEHEVIYEYTDQNSCTVATKTFINILEAPEVSLSAFDDVCENGGVVAMLGGSPVGGAYFNDYIKDNNFYPELSGSGFHVITYTYTNGNGCTASAEKNINVLVSPTVTLPKFTDVCQNGEPVLLSGGLPVNGTYYFDDAISALLNPENSTSGVHIVKYEYTNDKGCTASAERALNILPSPIVYMPVVADICQNGNSVELSSGYPSDGTYYVNEVEKTLINPSLYDAGNHSVKYSYTNNYGCSENESDVFSVLPKPEVTLTVPFEICEDAESFTLTGGLPEGGTYTGDGVVNGVFYPSIGAGEYTIRYTVTNSDDCSDYAEKLIVVNPSPTVTLERIDDICHNAEAFTLSDGLPKDGYYSIENEKITSFNPADYDTGNHTIIYTYENEKGCSNFGSRTFSVLSSPQAIIGTFDDICEDAESFTLTGGLPEGGEYTGAGIVDTVFYPSIGAGKYTIHYAVTNDNECSSFAETSIQVLAAPTVTLESIDDICHNAEAFTLDGGLPEDGYYFVNDTIITSFNPAVHNVGEHEVIYEYTNESGCSNTAMRNFKSLASPVVTLGTLDDICQNGEAFTLTSGLPVDGKYSINDVQLVTFNPQDYTPAVYTVRYKYGLENGCSEIAETTIEVLDIPVVPELDTKSVYCPGQEFNLKTDNTEYTVNWFTEDMNELKADSESVTLKSDAPFTTYVQYKNIMGCVSPLKKLEINVETISLDIETIYNEVEQGTPVQFESNVKTPGDVVEYYWQFSDGNISFERNPWYYCNLVGENNVSLEITTENGCTLSQTVDGIVNVLPEIIDGTEMIAEDILFEESTADEKGEFEYIYPNPATDRVYIQTANRKAIEDDHNVMIRILNLSGDIIKTRQETLNENIKLNISDLDVGMYIVQIIDLATNQIISRQKIMKKGK